MKSRNSEIAGSTALFGAGFLFGASSPVARLIGSWLPLVLVIFVRFLFAAPYLIWRVRKESFSKLSWRRLLPVAVLGSASPILFTLALFYTKIALATFFFYIFNMISSIVIGRLLNAEKSSLKENVAFVFGLLAIVIIANPFAELRLDIGSLLAAIAGILASTAYYYQKKLSRQYTTNMISLAQIVMGVAVAILLFITLKPALPNSFNGALLLLCVLYGAMNAGVIYLLSYGFKHAKLGVGTLLTSIELVLGPLFAYLLFHERILANEIVGGIFIVLATIMVAYKSD